MFYFDTSFIYFLNLKIQFNMKICLVVVCLLVFGLAQSQCDMDRHNTTLSSGWLSCEISPSPNPIRGDSHWIQYDLSEPKRLGTSHFWNLSHPEAVTFGVRQIAISTSLDAITWEELGIVEAPIGESSGFYQGVPGFDFGGVSARYVLFTALNNHAGSSDCIGFSEIRVQIEQATSTVDLSVQSPSFTLYPNPASAEVNVAILDLPAGNYKMQLLDLSGRTVIEQQVQIAESSEFKINTSQIESGQYFVSLQQGQLVKQAKLTIIQK